MYDAGDSQVILYWSKNHQVELLFKESYFVSGIGRGIAERFKDPAME